MAGLGSRRGRQEGPQPGRGRRAPRLVRRVLRGPRPAAGSGSATPRCSRPVADQRNRDALRELQDTIVEWAAQYEFKQWATLVRQLAADLDQDGSFDPDEDQKRARLRLRDNLDGTVELKGLLGGATVTVTQGLESIADELFRRYSADREQGSRPALPSRKRLMAEALGEAVRRARAVDLDSTRQPAVEALIVIEEGEDGGAAVSDLSGRQVPGSIAEALLVDPRLRAMTTDVEGNPLWLGRTTRLATRAQRLALAARDGGCIFPAATHRQIGATSTTSRAGSPTAGPTSTRCSSDAGTTTG
ncbi:MAG: DUF222 domain-containing protein [Microthrixaceae bacterium]